MMLPSYVFARKRLMNKINYDSFLWKTDAQLMSATYVYSIYVLKSFIIVQSNSNPMTRSPYNFDIFNCKLLRIAQSLITIFYQKQKEFERLIWCPSPFCSYDASLIRALSVERMTYHASCLFQLKHTIPNTRLLLFHDNLILESSFLSFCSIYLS